MLESIALYDFRLHHRLKIEFGPHTTTIIGRSYSGKSTIIRALRWVCLNKPSGTSVIKWGAKRAKVILKIDGHTITRIREKSENIYKLDGETFKAFGNEVPRKIAALLNISETNFQGQHSLPFWFGETAGEVSRKLNGIVNLSIIDTTLSNLATEARKAHTAVEISKERLMEVKQEKITLSYVPVMQADWEKVKQAQAKYESLDEETARLEELVESARKLKSQKDKAKPPAIINMCRAAQVYKALNTEIEALETALERAKRLEAQTDRAKKEAERLEDELKRLSKGKCPLCGRKKNRPIQDPKAIWKKS